MSRPFMWPNKVFYYAIGNTPPVCLTQNLPPEENADVLLLGCGDPRSILYTLHASVKSPEKPRSLDFTCCDIEPAILARNALLFTLVVDGAPVNRIWNIFYHFKIDQDSLTLLVEQCEKLISVSGDLDLWLNSKYSSFLRVCTHRTLAQLRHHWQLYIQASKFSKQKSESIVALFSQEYKHFHGSATGVLSTSRSAGPFMYTASQVQASHFQHYWQTGTVFPAAKDVASATLVNPTFIYSIGGEGAHLHYGSYPLQSFHLFAAFAPESKFQKSVTIQDLFACARSQFQQWCDAFKASVMPDSRSPTVIRLFVGDALAFCHTLLHCHATSSISASQFVSAFAAAELVLDGGDYGPNRSQAAPIIFNVIDTSNISDHVGLLNILVTTVPLLIHSPSSTLYTESLLATDDGEPLKSFVYRLCTNIPAISILLGVAPVDYLSGFISHSNVHEIILSKILESKQYHERIAWKIPYLGDAIALRRFDRDVLCPTFEPREIAKLLFEMYYHMFEHEDVFQRMQKIKQNPKAITNFIYYDRGTFTALLGLVKSRVRTDWETVIDCLLDMSLADRRLILGSNFYQALICELHRRGIYIVDIYRIPPHPEWMRTATFRNWTTIPPMVCLLLVIPRQKLKILDTANIGTPILQCDLQSSSFHNIFSAIQLVFGSLTIEGTGSDARAIVKEDAKGFSGSSDLVLSTWIPSCCFVVADSSPTKVGVGVHSTPAMVHALRDKLGLTLKIFAADLLDRKHVQVVAQSPYFVETRGIPKLSSPTPTHEQISVAVRDTEIWTLTAKWDITQVAAEHVQGEVKSRQVSPCVMEVTLGDVSKLLVYPFPVNGKESRLRVARKSGWIEVVVPLSGHRNPGGFMQKNFPLLPRGDGVLTTWNIHRLNLDCLPTFDPRKHKTDWVNSHISLGLSDHERSEREKETPPTDVLVDVKDTIHALFIRATEPNALRIFALSEPANGVYTIILVKRLCFDLASFTLVADTCILPLTHSLLDRCGQAIANLTSTRGKMMQTVTKEAEVTAWKHLLPAFVERCRTWSHKPTCAYIKTGEIPLDVDIARNPICACGEGVGLEKFGEVAGWKALTPYMTRAAISQLFAVSYLESVAGTAKTVSKKKGKDDVGEEVKKAVDVASCARCGKGAIEAGGKLMKCSRCTTATYCSKACQTADWPQHKVGCKK